MPGASQPVRPSQREKRGYTPRGGAGAELTGRGRVVNNQAALAVRVRRRAGDVDGAAHPHDAVRVRGSQDALRRHVEDCPALGNVKVRGQVPTGEVGQAVGAVGLGPVVAQAAVVGRVHGLPAVVSGAHALGGVVPLAAEVVDVPRLQHVDAVDGRIDGPGRRPSQHEQGGTGQLPGLHSLLEHGTSVGVDLDIRVGESPNSGHCAKVLDACKPRDRRGRARGQALTWSNARFSCMNKTMCLTSLSESATAARLAARAGSKKRLADLMAHDEAMSCLWESRMTVVQELGGFEKVPHCPTGRVGARGSSRVRQPYIYRMLARSEGCPGQARTAEASATVVAGSARDPVGTGNDAGSGPRQRCRLLSSCSTVATAVRELPVPGCEVALPRVKTALTLHKTAHPPLDKSITPPPLACLAATPQGPRRRRGQIRMVSLPAGRVSATCWSLSGLLWWRV